MKLRIFNGVVCLMIAIFFSGAVCMADDFDEEEESNYAPLTDVETLGEIKGKPLVVGSIEATIGTKSNFHRWSFELLVMNAATKEIYGYWLSKNGPFYWSLPPGKYVITTLAGEKGCVRNLDPCGEHRIWATFTVPETNSAVYIGKLRLFRHYKAFFPKVENNLDAAGKKLKLRFPGFNQPLEANFMKLEERL